MSDSTPPAGNDSVDPGAAPGELTETERAVLALEQLWWKYPATKEDRVRSELGVSMTRYYQLLNALIDTPQALAADPVTVHRLRRLRQQRRASRTRSDQL